MADWEDAPSGWEDAPTVKGKPLPANAGLASLGASVAGLPADTIENVINLTRAAQGGIAGLAGRTDFMPPLLEKSPMTSAWLKEKLRSTGMPGLSPDNPTPNSAMGKGQYDFVSRGGVIPGAAVPAAASMAAEAIAGPEYAGVGAMAPGAVGQAVRGMAPKPTPQTELLQKEGVSLTPGQQYGGAVKRAEDAATSIPVLGDTIKSAQRRGLETFDTAAINRGLAPIGERLPKGMSGNRAIDYAYGKLGDAYDGLLPKLHGTMDQPLKSELSLIHQSGGQTLPRVQQDQLKRIIENEVIRRFNNGYISGPAMKDIESKLGGMAKDFGRSENYDIRTLGESVKDTQAALRSMLERNNPNYAGELSKINDGYANFKIAQKAATSVAAQDGVFSPAHLHGAVKAKDASKDKARFAEGNARMQDLSSAGKAVLPSSVPDSGTPFRAATMYAMSHPLKATVAAPFVAAAALPYTQVGQGALARMSAGRPTSPSLQALLQSILANQQ